MTKPKGTFFSGDCFWNFRWYFLVSLLSLVLISPLEIALAEEEEEESATVNQIELLEPLPGGATTISTEGGAVSILEAYISDIFLFGSGFISLVAVIWIIIGGYEIMFRGSFAGSVEEGKQKITQALLGMVLLLLSALILNFVNPGFFQF